MMKPFAQIISILFFCLSANGLAAHMETYFSEEEAKARVKEMPMMFKVKYDDIVASYLRTYFVKARPKASRIIGNTSLYFPIFEQYIAEKNLPRDLRFLPILESALNPTAESRSGAMGLWQFMERTGNEYGLINNFLVDERKDPHKSTKAALTYLEKLYNKYGDWSLAIAAYNGGPGTVNRAIKRGKSKNFWKIRRYLPRETRNYIPAFTAATYLFKYYELHGINPLYPELSLQMTDYVKVYEELSFQKIYELTGIPIYTIEYLNPSYKQKKIYKSYNGNYLILPSWAIDIIKMSVSQPDVNVTYTPSVLNRFENINYLNTSYVVQSSDNIYKVAELFKCRPYQIKLWNNLRRDYLKPGEQLRVYMETSNIPPKSQKKTTVSVASPLPQKEIAPLSFRVAEQSQGQGQFVYHLIKPGESILEISNFYEGVSLEDLFELNEGLKERKGIFPGRKIRIKKARESYIANLKSSAK